MHKIYSRRRFRILQGKYKKKISKMIIILTIAFETAAIILNNINPIFEKVSIYEAKKVATFISNEQTTLVMKNYNYDSMFSVEKDSEGNVSMIETNMYRVNLIISDIAYKIQEEFQKPENNSISIPIGSFTGIDLLSGIGPNVKLKVVLLGNVETDLRSEFIEKVLTRLYIEYIYK